MYPTTSQESFLRGEYLRTDHESIPKNEIVTVLVLETTYDGTCTTACESEYIFDYLWTDLGLAEAAVNY